MVWRRGFSKMPGEMTRVTGEIASTTGQGEPPPDGPQMAVTAEVERGPMGHFLVDRTVDFTRCLAH